MPFSFAAILNFKLPSNKFLRGVALEARRYTVSDLFENGVVDVVAKEATGAAILEAARELAKRYAPLAKGGTWGLIKVWPIANFFTIFFLNNYSFLFLFTLARSCKGDSANSQR